MVLMAPPILDGETYETIEEFKENINQKNLKQAYEKGKEKGKEEEEWDKIRQEQTTDWKAFTRRNKFQVWDLFDNDNINNWFDFQKLNWKKYIAIRVNEKLYGCKICKEP